jgi:methylmalonyl-CoA/ethylmalonyl-CoA epimerase
MDKTNKKVKVELTPSQIAWVVKDVEKSKAFFQEMFGVTNFSPTGPVLFSVPLFESVVK